MNLPMGYPLRMLPMTSRDRMTGIMVTSYFFKMLLLRQFLSELDDTLTQCSSIRCVYMILTDSQYGTYDVTDDVIM